MIIMIMTIELYKYVTLYNMIEVDNSFKLVLVEEKSLLYDNPLSNYYYKLDDLSINLNITFKWILWGYKFLYDLSIILKENKEELTHLIMKSNQNKNNKINEFEYIDHLIILDDEIINNINHLNYLIINNYSSKLFTKNTKIHFKLKMNLSDYLILTNNLYPTLIKF